MTLGNGGVSYEYSFHKPDRFFFVMHIYRNECCGVIILEKWHIHNIFTIFVQQIPSVTLLLLGQKSNFSVSDDAQKIISELIVHTFQWVHLKNKREEPIKWHRWGTGQRPSKVKLEKSSNNARQYEL